MKGLLQKDPNLAFSVSCTTRSPRPHEIEGVDYYFITREAFQKLIQEGAFAEWEMVYNDVFYGTLKSEVERLRESGRDVLFDVDVVGGFHLKKIYGDDALSFFVKPPSLQVLEQRLRARETESEAMVQQRLKKAVQELTYEPFFDVVILNDDLSKAIEQSYHAILKFKNKDNAGISKPTSGDKH